VAFIFFKWQEKNTGIKKITGKFAQNQNKILAHEALRISKKIQRQFDRACEDAKVLSLIPKNIKSYSDFLEYRFYSRALFSSSERKVDLNTDLKFSGLKSFMATCQLSSLCDAPLLEETFRQKHTGCRIGKLMRWYVPRESTVSPIQEEATISVAYKNKEGVYLLSISYKSIQDILAEPTFPYEARTDLMEAYEKGSYTYLVDRELDIIAHPLYWHITGLNPLFKNGQRMLPMVTDEEAGLKPLNIKKYQKGKLKKYFDRLLSQSFPREEVDIFESTNLGGASRVLSVIPIYLNPTYFLEQKLFGYAVVGCSLEYFEQPEERQKPYY
jgi:hypothetical protein